MTFDTINMYNGKMFPEYIFDLRVQKVLFFEFHYIFHEEFLKVLRNHLNYNLIPEIRIENLDPPSLHLSEVIEVKDLPTSFFNVTKSALKQEGYNASELSLHMLTEVSVIYPATKGNTFCIVLYRSLDIAIMGLEKSSDKVWYEGLDIGGLNEVEAQVAVNFKNEILPDDFKKALFKNWNR